MSGDASNARQWADANVYIAFSLAETIPADIDTAFGAGWDNIGLLNGDSGFVESREEDQTDFFAWGGLLIRTARRNYVQTHKFTALESSLDVVDRLRYPGSTNAEIVVPSGNRIEPVMVAFETIDQAITRRVITRNFAEVTVDGDTTESEQALTEISLMAKIFPDTSGVLFDRQSHEVLSV